MTEDKIKCKAKSKIEVIKKFYKSKLSVSEFSKELQNNNKAFIDAIKKGVILFGQENFVKFMEKVH